MYDIAIIGAGPAGLSAAITARARDKDVIIISNRPQESPLAKSKLINNYPGLPGISGVGLLENMLKHANELGVNFKPARVISVLPVSEGDATTFSITTSDDFVDAKSVILAFGAQTGGKPYPGEQEYLGRGVSYCATCDGMLYRNATVCVAGLSTEAVSEANFLAGLGATVHFISKAPAKDLDTQDAANTIYAHTGVISSIDGDALGVTGVTLKEGDKDAHINCTGVFVLRPSVAPNALLATLQVKDGFVNVDAHMRTNVPGVFAAGDCTGAPLQVAKAVGEGQVACFAAVDYLAG
ncbi:MAG: NAD(P)/FAD-dependent oxidoreductase [Coriobacteriales bacterium]|jgi:thioredoxin reductase (NADPH)|nr:NAD(P)/FAD-dependent oxidoreductase [Coriobacteriales bacterium]